MVARSLRCTASLRRAWGSMVRLFSILIAATMLVMALPSSAGQERYDYDPIGRLIRYVDSSGQVTEYSYDPAGNITSVVRGGSAAAYAPSISGISPSFVRRGETRAITINGQRLQVGTLQAIDPALDLASLRQSATQVNADLIIGTSANLGTQSLVFSNAEGAATASLVVGPLLPTLSVEPSPLALPPDNIAHAVTLRLSGADVMGHSISVASSNPSKATVSPSVINIAAGQTSAQINVTSIAAGFADLVFTSSTLKSVTVPVFIATDFRGVNTSYAEAVGVVVGSTQTTVIPTASATFASAHVGIAVGSVLTGISPKGLPVAASSTLVIDGFNIPTNSIVNMGTSTGVVLGASSVSSDGKQISVPISIAVNAPTGMRRVSVRDSAGNLLPFASAEGSMFIITSGQPEITSVSPLYGTAGARPILTIRGSHLQNAQVRILPDTDLRLDSQPSINQAGTEISLPVQIAPLAASGSRVVQVMTPSGQTSAQANNANQWTIVSEIKSDVTPIMAQAVGVIVGSATPSSSQTISPIVAQNIGVVVGQYALDIQPRVAVVGTTSLFTITGQGLQAVQSVSSLTSTGLTISAPIVSNNGTQLVVEIATGINAPKTLRRLILNTASGHVDFVELNLANILVAAPAPELISIVPQIIQTGQTATLFVRGRNLRDIQTIRFEPDPGLSLQGLPSVNSEGSELSVNISASSSALTGARTLIVVAAGGASSNVPIPANTFYVAQQAGPAYGAVMAQAVGVRVGSTATVSLTQSLAAYAPEVGVMVQSMSTQQTAQQATLSPQVGVVVGPYITGISPSYPDGLLKGSTSTVYVMGAGLDQASSVQLIGSPSLSLGTYSVNASGTQLSLPISVPANSSSSVYGLRVFTMVGTQTSRITSVNEQTGESLRTGALPLVMDSVAPIVLEQGKTYSFIVRGVGLQDVYQIIAEPSTGLIFNDDLAPVVWSNDAQGEKLTVRLKIESNAPIGNRVIRLKVPGGQSDAIPIPANTITIVQP